MEARPTTPARVRFSVFEVDLHSGEVWKGGTRVSLQEQPFRVLARLLQRPGELVTRDELRQELWAADTYVDFDHGLNAAVRRLRDTLGDSADTPRFIETLPRHGYRFIAPVQSVEVAAPLHPPPSGVRAQGNAGKWLVVIAGVSAAMIGLAMTASRANRRPSMTAADVIVLADLENHTTESVLTGTIKQALAVKLSESRFVNLLSEERVRDTLGTMRRKLDEPLTPALARDVCQRVGAKATLTGAIATVGTTYVISLNIVLCSTGETLARDQAEAARKEEILPALDRMTVRLRRRLGESLPAIAAANTPLERATTSSLEALKAFTEGERRFLAGAQLAAIPLYRRAIELDPDFAMAHAKLGVVCFNCDLPDGIPELTRAFELRHRLTEREQFYVTAHYHRLARGDLEASRPIYEVWKAAYPRDMVPSNSLGLLYIRQGRLDRAVAEFEEAARVAPIGFTYSNLFSAYLQVGRVAEAGSALGRWERTVGAPMYYGRFLVAFHKRNPTAVEMQGAALRNDQPGVNNADAARARAAAFFGRMRRARELFASAERVHEGPDFVGESTLLKLEEAIWEAEIGNCREARERVADIWPHRAQAPPQLAPALSAIALAACGDVARAAKVSEGLSPLGPLGWPRPTLQILVPATRARIDLARRRFTQALETLRSSELGDMAGPLGYGLAGQAHGLINAYLRGQAYLSLRQHHEAIAEFQKIANHPGIAPFAPYQALAPLYLARAYAGAGELERSRAAYELFLSLWKDADPDIPVLSAALQEHARLPKTVN